MFGVAAPAVYHPRVDLEKVKHTKTKSILKHILVMSCKFGRNHFTGSEHIGHTPTQTPTPMRTPTRPGQNGYVSPLLLVWDKTTEVGTTV